MAAQNFNLVVEKVPGILGDNQIAGILDRRAKKIQIATKFSQTSQLFTLAHEFGHYLLHPGQVYFRDRELSAPGNNDRDYFEIEADAFAAEFLMPRHYLEPLFLQLFGNPIDGSIPNQELSYAVSAGKKGRDIWTPQAFASAEPLERASAIAAVNIYCGITFAPLTEHFGVSRKAMGIQLLQMGLVK
jgi:Zn-dependent peptidase ImmA (M78 family)